MLTAEVRSSDLTSLQHHIFACNHLLVLLAYTPTLPKWDLNLSSYFLIREEGPESNPPTLFLFPPPRVVLFCFRDFLLLTSFPTGKERSKLRVATRASLRPIRGVEFELCVLLVLSFVFSPFPMEDCLSRERASAGHPSPRLMSSAIETSFARPPM